MSAFISQKFEKIDQNSTVKMQSGNDKKIKVSSPLMPIRVQHVFCNWSRWCKRAINDGENKMSTFATAIIHFSLWKLFWLILWILYTRLNIFVETFEKKKHWECQQSCKNVVKFQREPRFFGNYVCMCNKVFCVISFHKTSNLFLCRKNQSISVNRQFLWNFKGVSFSNGRS